MTEATLVRPARPPVKFGNLAKRSSLKALYQHTWNNTDVIFGVLGLLALPVGLVIKVGDGFAKAGDCPGIEGRREEDAV